MKKLWCVLVHRFVNRTWCFDSNGKPGAYCYRCKLLWYWGYNVEKVK